MYVCCVCVCVCVLDHSYDLGEDIGIAIRSGNLRQVCSQRANLHSQFDPLIEKGRVNNATTSLKFLPLSCELHLSDLDCKTSLSACLLSSIGRPIASQCSATDITREY